MGTHILDARSPWWLNFVCWHLIFADSQYGTCSMSLFWCLEFWGRSQICGKFVHSCSRLSASHIVLAWRSVDALLRSCAAWCSDCERWFSVNIVTQSAITLLYTGPQEIVMLCAVLIPSWTWYLDVSCSCVQENLVATLFCGARPWEYHPHICTSRLALSCHVYGWLIGSHKEFGCCQR